MENKQKSDQNPEFNFQEENSQATEMAAPVSNESEDVKAEMAQDEIVSVEHDVTTPSQPAIESVTEEVPVEQTIEEVPVEQAVEEVQEEPVVEEVSLEPAVQEVPAEQSIEVDAAEPALEEVEKDEEVVEEIEEEEENLSEESFDDHSLEMLVSELEAIVAAEKVTNTKTKVGYIRLVFGKKINQIKKEAIDAFVEAGGIIEEYKPEPINIENQFNRAFSQYKKLRRNLRDHQEVIMVENLKKKNELLEEIRELVNSDETLKETYDKFNEIQNRWKAAGMVPKTEIQNLWNNYHFLVEKFFDKVKINKELRDLDLKKNLEAKITLCEKVEELLLESSITKSFKLLQEYHNEWKAIGPVPSSNNDEIWERFKVASDKINDRRKNHYDELQGKLEENYIAKQALCAKAEEMLTASLDKTKDWTKRNEEFDELMKVWKTIGPAPRKVNDEIWAQFKGYFNQFYDQKKVHFSKIKTEQQENYHLKLDLVKQAQALKDNTDWNSATKALINLQQEWKKIGAVSRKHSDEIWKQFRTANDHFFEAKAKHFKGQIESEEENLKNKLALIEEIKTADYSNDKKANLEKIKQFQRRWTEIGNVPKKDMDKLYKGYRAVVDEQLNKLDITSSDFRNTGYKERVDDTRKHEDTSDLGRERMVIQKSLDKIKEDVRLWENNMGFFRNSKNAEVLKLEFEKKISLAKAEILVLREKLRMLDK